MPPILRTRAPAVPKTRDNTGRRRLRFSILRRAVGLRVARKPLLSPYLPRKRAGCILLSLLRLVPVP
eukprot:1360106-Pyramimonas_sp.AAC.2